MIKLASLVATAAVVAGLVSACAVSEEDGSDASYSSGEQELTSSKTVGDWKLFGGGECLAAVQNFYPNKFNVSIPVAGPGWYGNCASHGACKIWVDPSKRPSSSDWERIPNDGKHTPTTYDLIVYPPIGNDPWGHIASVDHVEGKNIFVMDANYVAHHQKAPQPHTVSWPAYGWYHLKKLGNSPAPHVSCVPGGYYCGGDKVTGNKSDLYKCNSQGNGESLTKACSKGCRVNAGRDDSCN